MTSHLKLVAPGVHTTVQDQGRRGFQDAGVPVSGPLDRIGLRLANALVGNPSNAPALEMILQGPTLEVQADAVRVALAGCNGAIEIGGAEPRRVAAGTSVRLVRGETFRITQLGDSGCACLAIEGGIAVPASLGSVSTYVRAAFGGLDGRALRRGDALALHLDAAPARPEKTLAQALDLALDQPIRVVLGPQADFFSAAEIARFTAIEYVVSSQSDRMGFRLDGEPLVHAKGYNIVSDGIVAGSIQVPGSGLPIVLLADAQTTGGYPKIATVISADLPTLGRRKPGYKVRFVPVSIGEAEQLRRQQETFLCRCIASMREVREAARIDIAALYTQSLISGFTCARSSS